MTIEDAPAYKPPSVEGMPDHDVDPEGIIPLPLLTEGIVVVVPLWPNPVTKPGERDRLEVIFEQTGERVSITKDYYPDDIKPEFRIDIGPEHLMNDGFGWLRYVQYNNADNPAYSEQRKLTIDHFPPIYDLKPASFPDATDRGYLNCSTNPPIWEGVHFDVPPLVDFIPGDFIEVTWRGYLSPNASGPAIVSKVFQRRALSREDIRVGYSEVVEPYDPYIVPMVDDASASIVYRIYRGAKLVGESEIGWVKIDRVRAGYPPCGPESFSAKRV
ncbi:hypothetical protein [Pseudomonas retamae]|uniref:Uncharacterized protein n=1 Tax=Pseudomonas retamae TaxID=702110 RepID=A0ABW7D4W1_9PSED